MSEFKENLKKIERLLKIAQIREEYTKCNDLYDFLGIDRTATKDEIKSVIGKKSKYYQSMQHVHDWAPIATEFSSSRRAIEYILLDCRSEYGEHLKEKKLRDYFISRPKREKELNSNEKVDIIEKGKELGLPEEQVIDLINKWIIEDGVKEVPSYSSESTSSSSMPFDVFLSTTHYEILGVPEEADYARIKDVKEKEYKKYNDTRDKSRANARWLLVSQACETLMDSKKRKEYDDKLRIKRETSATFKTYLDFSSGARATSLIEAANLIDKHWEEAKQKLVNGYIEGWLGSNGNTILAVEVKAINGSENNKDIALEKVIQAFKVGRKNPSIEISPTSIDFAAVESGKSVSKTVQVTNTGDRGFLYGEIEVPDFISISNSEIALKSKESISITLTIDTTEMAVQKNYKASMKIITNASHDAELPVVLRVTYPILQTAWKFIQYGGIGALIGVCLRGILNGSGLSDWMFRRYDYCTWQTMWNSANSDHVMISIVFILFLLSFYGVYRALRN